MREAVGVKGGKRGEAVIASEAAPFFKQIGGRRDGGQRGPEFVRKRGQEFVLAAGGGLQKRL